MGDIPLKWMIKKISKFSHSSYHTKKIQQIFGFDLALREKYQLKKIRWDSGFRILRYKSLKINLLISLMKSLNGKSQSLNFDFLSFSFFLYIFQIKMEMCAVFIIIKFLRFCFFFYTHPSLNVVPLYITRTTQIELCIRWLIINFISSVFIQIYTDRWYWS